MIIDILFFPKEKFTYITNDEVLLRHFYIIENDITIEIINFLPLKLNRVTTINSSSIDLVFNAKEKILLFEKYKI